jgi:hypothetical protein
MRQHDYSDNSLNATIATLMRLDYNLRPNKTFFPYRPVTYIQDHEDKHGWNLYIGISQIAVDPEAACAIFRCDCFGDPLLSVHIKLADPFTGQKMPAFVTCSPPDDVVFIGR